MRTIHLLLSHIYHLSSLSLTNFTFSFPFLFSSMHHFCSKFNRMIAISSESCSFKGVFLFFSILSTCFPSVHDQWIGYGNFFFYQTLPLLLFDTLVNFRGCIDRWSMIKFADRTAKFYGTSKKMILFFDIWDVLRRSKIILYFSRQYRLVTARIAGILMKLSQDLVNLVSFIRIPETCDYNNSDLFLSIHFLRVESKTF